jgi:3-oxoacyl-[acyl-carrier protein] reductase
MGFANKVAIVTGAGAGGIGEGIATSLAIAGAKIVVAEIDERTGRLTVEKIRQGGGDALYLHVDIASEESAQAMARQAAAHFGRIDYLVNNAALFGGMEVAPLLTMDWAALKRHFDINILGGLCVTRAVVPHMQKVGGGAIVNTSSTAAWIAGSGHYGVAKLAVNGLVISLSRELGPLNIRINAIAPGMTDTPAMRAKTPEAYQQMLLSQLAIQRLGTPQDQANVVKFLLSDEASFITGAIIPVDGGSVCRP